MDPKRQCIKDMEPPVADEEQYHKPIIHLTICTRPDTTFSVNVLARYNQDPWCAHWTAGIDFLRYIMGFATLALTYGSEEGGLCTMIQVLHQATMTTDLPVGIASS